MWHLASVFKGQQELAGTNTPPFQPLTPPSLIHLQEAGNTFRHAAATA